MGSGTNNFAELSALRFLLCWLQHRNINTIQIFGDSLNVINWINGKATCQNQILKNIVEEIMILKSFFNRFLLYHIYRDRNEEAYQLSKAGLQQDSGSWTIEEIRQGKSFRSDQPPYFQSFWSQIFHQFWQQFLGYIFMFLYIISNIVSISVYRYNKQTFYRFFVYIFMVYTS